MPTKLGQDKIYQMVTDRILEALDKGTVPWHKPWHSEGGFDKNLVSKKPYRGINILILATAGYSSPYWATIKQIQQKGGKVIKGEKSTPIVFWKFFKVEEQKKEGGTREKTIPYLRYYHVFNIEQTEGLKVPEDKKEKKNQHQAIESAEAVLKGMPKPPQMRFGGGRACYSPPMDQVTMPKANDFDTPEAYYSVFFHELVHSTGHESRCKREELMDHTLFADHQYSREELVAEIGAAMLCANTGIETKTFDNSVAYIQTWRKKLSEDKKLIVTAAGRAQKGSDFILNVKYEEKKEKKDV